MDLPEKIATVERLEQVMTTPSAALVRAMGALRGDVLIPRRRRQDGADHGRTRTASPGRGRGEAAVIGVARFSRGDLRDRLELAGVRTITADLLSPGALETLPDAENVIYLVGQKFGSTGNEPLTWAMNVHLPALVPSVLAVADRRLVHGNVYPFTPVASAGPRKPRPSGRSASMPSPVSAASGCSSISAASTARRGL